MILNFMKKRQQVMSAIAPRERVERAIVSIGKKEIQDMIDDQKPIEVNCHFCGKHYEFNVDELKNLLKKAVRA